MADLFYNIGDSLQEKIDLLREDLLIEAKALGYKKKKLPVLTTSCNAEEIVGNNALIIHPPIDDGRHIIKENGKRVHISPFKDRRTEMLMSVLDEYGMYNYFITYSHLIPMDKHTKRDIKNFGIWISRIVEIVQPKLIVVLGEDAELVFSKRKHILNDNHGLIVEHYQNIPIFLSYPMEYYSEQSAFEDSNFKKFIMDNDWNKIKKEYDRRIICQ